MSTPGALLVSANGQDDEDVKDLKSEGGDGQEVDRNHAVEVIAKEGFPVGRMWPPRAWDHVFGNGSLGDIEAELEQFAMDSGSAPQRIGTAHLPDQFDGLRTGGLAPRSTRPAFPAPEQAEPGPVPTDDSARLNDAEAALPICPGMREPRPEGAVQRGQARTFCATAEDQKLVSQSQVFEE